MHLAAQVLFMTIPGLSLFYAGLVKQKNVLSVLVQCFSITALMTVLWAACGYSLSFSAAGMQEGVVNAASFIGNLDKAFLAGVSLDSVTGTIPEALWVMFQVRASVPLLLPRGTQMSLLRWTLVCLWRPGERWCVLVAQTTVQGRVVICRGCQSSARRCG
jgi:hypothetical protein